MLEFIGTGFLRVPVSVLCHVKLIIFELHVLKTRSYTRIFLKSSDFWKEKDKLIIKQHLVV